MRASAALDLYQMACSSPWPCAPASACVSNATVIRAAG